MPEPIRVRPVLLALAGALSAAFFAGCVTTDSSDNGPLAPVRGVLLDPGHGGEPPQGSREECYGAISAAGFKEKTGTLAVARKAASLLRQAGFRTAFTRDSDTFVTLDERVAIASRPEYRDWVFVSIHFNRSQTKQQATKLSATYRHPHGFEIYVMPRPGTRSTQGSRAPSGYATVNHARSSNLMLAHCIGDRLEALPGMADRGTKEAWFVVLRETPMPAILIEAGFLSNPEEGQRIATDAWQTQLARAITEGIRDYAARANLLVSSPSPNRGRS